MPPLPSSVLAALGLAPACAPVAPGEAAPGAALRVVDTGLPAETTAATGATAETGETAATGTGDTGLDTGHLGACLCACDLTASAVMVAPALLAVVATRARRRREILDSLTPDTLPADVLARLRAGLDGES